MELKWGLDTVRFRLLPDPESRNEDLRGLENNTLLVFPFAAMHSGDVTIARVQMHRATLVIIGYSVFCFLHH